MDDSQTETRIASAGLMADEIEIEPKAPVNPAGKPGVGGLAAIPSAIGAILGADDFCSVWNVPLSGTCLTQFDETTGKDVTMPAWCFVSSSGPYCNTVPVDEPIVINKNICFDSNFYSINCNIGNDTICSVYSNANLDKSGFLVGESIPCNDVLTCITKDGVPFNCNFVPIASKSFRYASYGTCYDAYQRIDNVSSMITPVSCKFNYSFPTNTSTFPAYSFDKYMRLVDNRTFMPIYNEQYEGGYPINAVYPPELDPEHPLPVLPYDPGPNPFDPQLPEATEGQECASIICECIKLVTNALGAVNNTILHVDKTLLGMVDQLDSIYDKMPNWFEKLPLELLPIYNKLGDILKAIDDISVDIAQEAESNIWDFLGDTIKELGDLIEFLIEKIIYLVVPENTDFLRENFTMLRDAMSAKMEPLDMLKTQISMSLMTEQKNFKDIEMNLPIYGHVKFLDVEFLNYAIPKIRALISGIMIIITSVWAYRKIASGMVK